MAARRTARLIAPLALVAFFLVFVVIVASSGDGGDSDTKRPTTAAKERSGSAKKTKPKAPPKEYTVKPGDLLSTIAEKSGVSVERLTELNPDLDPQALTVGQKVKLRP